MKKKIVFLLFIVFLSITNQAQTIKFTLPEQANKKYSFLIPNGLKTDTICSNIISMLGKGEIIIPEKYRSIPAMGMLAIEGVDPINIILEKNDFSFNQDESKKITFNGSEENDLLYHRQNDAINSDSTYAHFFLQTSNILYRTSKILTKGMQATLFEKSNIKIEITRNIDVDKLYYSRFWFFIIDGLLNLSFSQEDFASNMIKLLDKTKTQEVYIALVNNLITITNQYGMDDAFDLIIPHVEASGRIEYPQGNIYDAFAMIKVRKGTVAPTIEGLKTPINKDDNNFTLIIFHQPGCDNCHQQLTLLNENYKFFVNNKVRVISISGDMDKDSFNKESRNFLWNDKLCDYKGYSGTNFKNFGIIGTPILYLIDSKNTILSKFSSVSDAKNLLIGIF